MKVLMVALFPMNTVASGRETSVMGKASHRGHRGHGGGNGDLDGGAPSVNTGACGRRKLVNGKASHRGHRGRNGDLDGSFRERPWLPCEKKAETLF
jgi:hypothetical protein